VAGPTLGDPQAAQLGRYGRYRLIEQIGKGGMAEVFRAVSEGLEGFRRIFVIKRIRPEKSDSSEFVQMFCDEARICALLNHPNIVQVYDFGQIAGSYFMAMEYLHGKDLSTVMRALRAVQKAVPPSLAAAVARHVAVGLHHAHTAHMPDGAPGQIVHRDVTPSNIMLLWTGGVKILDFGIAKAAAMARQVDTQAGRVRGKLAYLAPEQVRGDDIDGRSDVFALGVVLWEMLTGQRLFTGENEFQTMRNVLSGPVPGPSTIRTEVPAALDVIVGRSLERDLARRYPSAQAMADALDLHLREAPCPSQAGPELLEELFGEDPGQESDVGWAPPAPEPRPPRSSSSIEIAGEGSSWTQGPAPRAPDRRAWRRVVILVAGATLVACFWWAARARNRHAQAALAPVAIAASPAAPPPAASDLAQPDRVVVTIESTPSGAEVGEGPATLGVTPLTVELTRSSVGRRLWLRKAGFAPAEHTVVPDRAQTLRAALNPVHRTHHQAPQAADERQTIDPFKTGR
jgi:serine/threonine-protein kinase